MKLKQVWQNTMAWEWDGTTIICTRRIETIRSQTRVLCLLRRSFNHPKRRQIHYKRLNLPSSQPRFRWLRSSTTQLLRLEHLHTWLCSLANCDILIVHLFLIFLLSILVLKVYNEDGLCYNCPLKIIRVVVE